MTKQRHIQNRITGLHNEEGNWVSTEQEVEGVALNYFTDLFSTTSPVKFDGFLEEVPTLVTETQNRRLMATEEEVRTALFMMHPEKATGPDGMTVLFLSAVLVHY